MDLHYKPIERLIFTFFDGQKDRKADPLELYKRLLNVAPSLSVDIKVAFSTVIATKDAVQAHNNLVAKAREIFNVKPIEEDGLTQVEVLDLLESFLGFCDDIKKKANFRLTSSTPTDQPSPPTNGLPTKSSSDCGSTGEGASTEKLG